MRTRVSFVYLKILPILIFIAWPAQSQVSGVSANDEAVKSLFEPHSRKLTSHNNATKYDISHIGQRSVGNGINIYSLERERALGRKTAANVEANSKLVHDPLVNDYIKKLAQKIIGNSDAQLLFEVRVLDSDEYPHVYGLPGGFLYVNSAAILSSDEEAELVAMMAHEIAHVAARHATRALTRRQLYHCVNTLALFAGVPGVVFNHVAGIAGFLSLKKFDRDAEYEADLLGIEYAYAAGYDPEALLFALEKRNVTRSGNAIIQKVPGHLLARGSRLQHIATSFSSHPLIEERIHRLQLEIPTFLPERRDYILDSDEFETVKARLQASQGLLIRRHSEEDRHVHRPVLRRPQDLN